LATLTSGPWIVQPVVDSVRTEGETSVYVFGGEAVSQLRKTPPAADIRVQEEHGGTTAAVALDPDAVALAERTVAVAGTLLGRTPAYARVDLLRWQGDLAVSELELIEPGLYLDLAPQNAEAFAEHVLG
jgi:glutathione synthase/RimK-type ligase-like ATP-grasp enzyme